MKPDGKNLLALRIASTHKVTISENVKTKYVQPKNALSIAVDWRCDQSMQLS